MKYKLIKEYNLGGGYINDKDGNSVPVTNYNPKIGDIIEGEITDTFFGNKPITGIKYGIDTGKDKFTAIIPMEYLEQVKEGNKAVKYAVTGIITGVIVFVIIKFVQLLRNPSQ